MSYQVPPDVARLVFEQIRQGAYASEDEVLRDALDALIERNADLTAIQAGIADMEAGRVHTLAEVDAHIRRNLGFPPPQ